jgi:N-acetylmuramoyl-L-alanine amidase
LAIRANHRVLPLFALLCAAALLCAGSTVAGPAVPAAVAASDFPVASDVRLAGDAKQTRFILDLDKTIQFRAFTLADPYRAVVDLPQVDFHLPNGAGTNGRGLVKAFRYGLVMPGGSRIVFDLTGPARISSSYVLDAANGQPPRLVLEFEEVDRAGFAQSMAADSRPELRPAIADAAEIAARETTAPSAPGPAAPADPRPVIVIDPGHGGIDNGTQSGNENEKSLVLAFGLALRDRIEKGGKYRVVMTRTDDTFIPLDDRVRIARNQSAALASAIAGRSSGRFSGASDWTKAVRSTSSSSSTSRGGWPLAASRT